MAIERGKGPEPTRDLAGIGLFIAVVISALLVAVVCAVLLTLVGDDTRSGRREVLSAAELWVPSIC